METITTARARRTYITDVHNSLAKKMGKEGADTLTNYLEDTIPAQIEDKVQYLATKEDVAKVELKLSGDIANVKNEVSKVEVKVAQLETQIQHLATKEDLAKVSANLTKWMLATIITIALGALALYLKN